ncbi:zinc finger protein 724-like [Lucilia sericata]|uniref:zinc finger protein 724-like n=1 Tax=Lucilia sericata TaxID=13632 RepID=UPI0018A80B45|nr:zinc finger protein 724-like [Lucilia sericata]
MLKLQTIINNDLSLYSSYTKCAEIHYFTSNFNIVCVVCQQLYKQYPDFAKHFQDTHLLEFMENIHELNSKNDQQLTKCVKQELTETIKDKNALNHRTEEVHKGIYGDVTAYDELLYFKVEDDQESFKANLTSNDDQINVTFTESPTNFDNEKTFDDELDWSQSFSPHHLKLNEKRPYKPRNQPNSCGYCGKTFRRRYQLDTHLNIHTGLKPHQCDVCGRQFRAITTLQRHLNTHNERETFTCQFCSKQFGHRAALVSHETRHTQERCIACDDCTKMFYTPNQLDTHKRKVHNKLDDYSLSFACDLCPKRYRTASMLSTHKFKKHYRMAKFSCEQCDKKFVEQSQLKEHMLSIHFKKCALG